MLISLGLDFRQADVRTRERFLLPEDRLRTLRTTPLEGEVSELALVGTCNRIEMYAWVRDGAGTPCTEAFLELARLWTGNPEGARALLGRGSGRIGSQVVDHLLRVASGLESQVLGDIHILGQVRRAYREAAAAGSLGPHLHRLFDTALRCGKAVKRGTALMAGHRSVGSEAALLLARQLRESGGTRVVVVGTGKTGTHAARTLAEEWGGTIVLVNRTPARAEALAAALPGGARAASMHQLHQELAEADGAIVATGSSIPIVLASHLHSARGHAGTSAHPLLILDASMPRNVETRCGQLPGLTLLDLDSLHPEAASVERARHAAVPMAEALVADHVGDYARWLSAAAAREALMPLRQVILEVCHREVGFAAGDEVAERAAGRIAAKLLARPMTVLREASERGESVSHMAAALELLFHSPRGETGAVGKEA